MRLAPVIGASAEARELTIEFALHGDGPAALGPHETALPAVRAAADWKQGEVAHHEKLEA